MSRSARREEREREFEVQQQLENEAWHVRLNGVYGLPTGARAPFLEMEDTIGESGARAVREFVEAMLAGES